MNSKMTKQDLEWQAESDAHTMAQYQEILGNKDRMNRAIKAANKQALDLEKRAKALQNAAKVRPSTRTSGRKK